MQISELTLHTANIEAQLTFYSQIFGLELAAQSDDSFAVQCGISRLRFARAEYGDAMYHLAWSIPPTMFASAKQWIAHRVPLLTADGVDEFDFASWNARSVYFRDAAGNILELIARRGVSAPGHEGTFGPHDLLSISEIGVPVANVRATVRSIEERFGVLPYGEISDDFAAVGDVHGLLIVVTVGRVWMPTSADRASSSPMEVRIVAPKAGSFTPPNTQLHIVSGKPGTR